jgi:hypothetical protein
MPIKFVCSCGKRLRAHDDMAARRSVCPRCGAPVGIPSLQPTARGTTLGPMSPAERQHHRQVARPIGLSSPDASPATTPMPHPPLPTAECGSPSPVPVLQSAISKMRARLPGEHVLQVKRRSWRHPREMEMHWYQCLLFPIRAWPLVLGLSIVLTGLSGGIALALPVFLRDFRADASWLIWPWLSIPFLILAYGAGFLNCVLTSAMAGEVRHIHWPGRDLGLALRAGVRWLICFLAGPVVPAGTSLFSWIHGGDLRFVDWMILAEANILAISCWFLLLLAVSQNDRLRDLHPAHVVEMIHRLGHRLVGLALLASVLALAHGWLVSVALEEIHRDAASGWLLLFFCCTSGMFFATFLFRWVGTWFYWDRMRANRQSVVRSP